MIETGPINITRALAARQACIMLNIAGLMSNGEMEYKVGILTPMFGLPDLEVVGAVEDRINSILEQNDLHYYYGRGRLGGNTWGFYDSSEVFPEGEM